MDGVGHARIIDFGLVMVTQDIRDVSNKNGRSARWLAPEIFDGREMHSKEADVFSFAGVAIEVRYK